MIVPAMIHPNRKIALSQALRERLSVSTVGTGGYQTLVKEVQSRLQGDELLVDDSLVERIEHYAFDYGSGGWQQLLRDLLAEIEASASRP